MTFQSMRISWNLAINLKLINYFVATIPSYPFPQYKCFQTHWNHLLIWLHLISIPCSPSSFTSFPNNPRLYELLSQLMSYQYIVLFCFASVSCYLSWNHSNICSISVTFWVYKQFAERRGNKELVGITSISQQLNPIAHCGSGWGAALREELLGGVQYTDTSQLSYLQDPQQCSIQGHTHPSQRALLEEGHSWPTQGISNGQNFPCPPPTRY